MEEKDILDKIEKENKSHVPDLRDKIVARAQAEGLLKSEDYDEIYYDGNAAVMSVGKRRALAISLCAVVAAVGLTIAIPTILTYNPATPVVPPVLDFSDAPVYEEMGVDYGVGAVATVKLMQNYAPAATASFASARVAADDFDCFGIYFSAFDSFFTEDMLEIKYNSHEGENYDKVATISGRYANGVKAEFAMYYCEALDINTSTATTYNYYLQGYITLGKNDYALVGQRTVDATTKTQTGLEISAYPSRDDKSTYAKMTLTDNGYEFTVSVGGKVESQATMHRPDDMENAAYIVDIAGADGGSFTVGMPVDGRNEVTVDYVRGDDNGQFFVNNTDFGFDYILCDYLIYSPRGDYQTVTGVKSDAIPADGKVVIPAYVGGKPVKTISAYALSSCKQVTEVVLPAGITDIGTEAFWNCTNLAAINFPESLETIGAHAFSSCAGMENLIIPKNVSYIGEAAFSGWAKLQTITVDPANTVIKGTGNCLIDGNGVLVAGCAQSVIPDDASVRSIGYGAFTKTLIESVSVPASVESICGYAFESCPKLTSITLPDTGLFIDKTAFRLSAYWLDDANWEASGYELYIGKHLLYANLLAYTGEYKIKKGTLTIVDEAILDGKVTNLVLNSELLRIGTGFMYQTAVDNISFDGENTNFILKDGCLIDPATGRLLVATKTATIPNDGSVKIIGAFSFNAYTKQSLTVPQSVRLVESYAFNNSAYLWNCNEIIFEGAIELESNALNNCGVKKIAFPLAICAEYAIGGGFDLEEITIGDTLLSSKMFYGCNALKSIITGFSAYEFTDMMYRDSDWFCIKEGDRPVVKVNCSDGVIDAVYDEVVLD